MVTLWNEFKNALSRYGFRATVLPAFLVISIACSSSPPAGSPSPSGASTVSQLSATQPTALGAVTLTPGGTCSLDYVDGATAAKESQPNDRSAFSVTGWGADVKNGLTPISTYFVLRDDRGKQWFAQTQATSRPDVANQFGVPALASSGYQAVVDASQVPDGEYEAAVAMQFAASSTLCNTGVKVRLLAAGASAGSQAPTIEASGQPSTGPSGQPSSELNGQMSATQPSALGSAALTPGGTCNLDEVDGATAGNESQPQNRAAFAVAGWGADVQNGVAPISSYFVLRDASGKLWFQQTQATSRPDVAAHYGIPALAASGYTATIDASPLPAGDYDVAIAMQFASGSTLCNTKLQIRL